MLKTAWSSCYNHPLKEGHRFPMIKYDLIKEQLLYEAVLAEANYFEPGFALVSELQLCHDKNYLDKLLNQHLSEAEIRRIGFPLSQSLIEREFKIMQGTIDCCAYAIQYGIAMNIAGGTHHAFSDKGEGFCLLNDFAVAAHVLLNQKKVNKIVIIDLDVHQGNGTASIFKNNDAVFTFSMHGKNNFPFKKEVSNLDIELPDGINDFDYLEKLAFGLTIISELPEIDFIFYQSGVDILQTDKLGKLAISQEACKSRDKMVFEFCKNRKTPVVTAMGGGYSTKISDIVNAHCNTFKAAIDTFF